MKNFFNKNISDKELCISAKYTIIIGWALLLSVLFPTAGLIIMSLITAAYLYQSFYIKQEV